MYHLRLKGTHYEMGRKRGLIFKKFNLAFPNNLDSFQLKHGLESEKLLAAFFPEIVEEMRGVTDALEIDYYPFAAWMLCMGCCMYNLEKNIPEVRGCTAMGLFFQGNVYYARNNDLPPFLEKSSKSEIYSIAGVGKFNLTTSSFINGEEGVNEYGLAVSMTFVGTEMCAIRPGFNSVFIVRYLLEKAHNVNEAKELIKKIPIASNVNILLIDKTGEMIVVECSPKMLNFRQPIHTNNGLTYIITVNNFTSNKMRPLEFDYDSDFDSDMRYKVALAALAALDQEEVVLYLIKLLRGEMGFMCQYDKKANFKTVWSSIFNLNTLEIIRAEGDPRRKQFKKDLRLVK